MFARVLQLYCPDMDVTVDDFIITPSMAYDNILIAIKAILPAPEKVFPHDVNGEPLFDLEATPFNNFVHGERLLIGVEEYERINPEPELEVVLYLEGDNLDMPLRKLSIKARGQHLRTLRRHDAAQRRNILGVNLPRSDIAASLQELEHTTPQQLRSKYSVTASKRILRNNWHIKALFVGSQKCLAALAILSEATCGQDTVVEDAL